MLISSSPRLGLEPTQPRRLGAYLGTALSKTVTVDYTVCYSSRLENHEFLRFSGVEVRVLFWHHFPDLIDKIRPDGELLS